MPIEIPFNGIGVLPQVANASALTSQRVRVQFSEAMRQDAALTTPANYTITPDGGSAARTVLSVVSSGDDEVILILDGALTVGVDNYNVQVALTVADVAGNTLDPAADDADFSGIATPATHCDLALARLAQQFRGKARIEALICLLASRMDEPELALQDVLQFRSLATAFGVQLDLLGAQLGLLRNGLTDSVYRVRLGAQALANASHGRPNELINLLLYLDNGFAAAQVYLHEPRIATVLLHCQVPNGQDALGATFLGFLAQAKAAGVRIILEFEEQGLTLFTWRLSDGSITPPANSGWGDGYWARAISPRI